MSDSAPVLPDGYRIGYSAVITYGIDVFNGTRRLPIRMIFGTREEAEKDAWDIRVPLLIRRHQGGLGEIVNTSVEVEDFWVPSSF